MSKSVFAEKPLPKENPTYNTYDLSHNVHGSYKFGYAYPVFCREVVSTQKVEITPNFGFQLEPLAFPVQTTLRARLHFFYVRHRTLYKDFMDFYGGTKEGLQMPWIKATAGTDRAKLLTKTGSLADHLGLPTTLNRSMVGNYVVRSLRAVDEYARTMEGPKARGIETSPLSLTSYPSSEYMTKQGDFYSFTPSPNIAIPSSSSNMIAVRGKSPVKFPIHFDSSHKTFTLCPQSTYNASDNDQVVLRVALIRNAHVNDGVDHTLYSKVVDLGLTFTYSTSDGLLKATLGESMTKFWNDAIATGEELYPVVYAPTNTTNLGKFMSNTNVLCTDAAFASPMLYLSYASKYEGTNQIDDTQSPFVIQSGKTTPAVPINALPFRAYQACCNAYYRNINNDPFIVNGQPEYNKYTTTDEGGADESTPLDLYKVNYELDAYTSALQSPQQGLAPLVGVTINPPMTRANLTFADEGGQEHVVTVGLSDDDDKRITAIDSYSEETPSGTLSRLRENILSGISINDLRNVSALQRFLENNVARGYRYKEQVESHFGKSPRFDVLQMPEFIGGCARNFDINKITNVAQTTESALGEIAGNGMLMSGCDKITHYCDEDGYIIGILSFICIPVYQDLLPKHFTKMNRLDYYKPEFAHLGFQAISRTEMCPLLTNHVNPSKLNETFGYQRPWYEYLGDYDSAHGQMRTNYENYLCVRTFSDLPQLNADFLKVDPDDVNKIFSITSDDEDKIIGMIAFHEEDTLPIPRFGRPQIV